VIRTTGDGGAEVLDALTDMLTSALVGTRS